MAENIKLTFLGTGSAIPTARRNHTAVLLKYKDETILMDCGEGTQRQFRKAKISMSKLTRILISHWHADHTLGLPGLMQSMIMNGYNKSLRIYGPRGSKRKIQEIINLLNIDANALKLEVHEVKDKAFIDEKEFEIETLSMDHGIPTNAYSFRIKEKNRLDKKKLAKLKIPNSPLIADLTKGKVVIIDGKKIDGKKLMYEEPSRKVSFIVDTKFNNNTIKISKNANLVISEASFTKEEQEIAEDHGHMTSIDAANIAKKAKAKKLALIHLSQRYDMIPKLILSEVKTIFKDSFVPEDLDNVEI